MSEEVMAPAAPVSEGGQSAQVSTEVSSVNQPQAVEQSQSDGFDALQSRQMGGLMYDPGTATVLDAQGNVLADAQGKPFKTIAEAKAYQAQTPQATNQQVTSQTAAKPTTFESQFQKDGQLNLDAVADLSGRFSKVNYQSMLIPQAPAPAPQQGAQQLQQATQQQPTTQENAWKEIDDFEGSLKSQLLDPINALYESTVKGITDPAARDAIYQSFNQMYLQKQEEVSRMVKAKEREVFDKRLTVERSTEAQKYEQERLRQVTDNNVKMVGRELFPEGGHDTLWSLLTGYQVDDGKGGKAFVKAPGAEYLEHLFDVSNAGKQYKSVEEYEGDFKGWWLNFASNENNLRQAAKVAYGLYLVNNQSKVRDQWRQAQNAERMQAQRVTSQPQPNAGGQAAMQTQEIPQELRGWGVQPRVSRV